MRTLPVSCLFFIVVSPCSVDAAGQKRNLSFDPPFRVAEIVERVQQRQRELDIAQFHSAVTVQFGTRVEWSNACAWLTEQTEKVMQYYVPPQNGNDEYYYFCGPSGTYTGVSVDALSEVDQLVNDFARQFGGSIVRWVFIMRDISEEAKDVE